MGIDIAPPWIWPWRIAKQGLNSSRRFPILPQGYSQLARWLQSQGIDKSSVFLISEYTGRYGEHLLRLGHRTGLVTCRG